MLLSNARSAIRIVKRLIAVNRRLLCDVPQVGIYDDSCGTNPKKPDLSDKRFSSNRDVCRQLFLRELGNGEPKTEDIPDLHNVTLEHFEKYIAEPTRTFDDLLAIDVRPLSSGVRLSCLEAILSLSHSSQLNRQKAKGLQLTEHVWPGNYLASEHLARWRGWDLGINPLIVPGDEPTWFRSQQFDLLVLSTAASANQLPLLSLLRLAGHFRYFWWYYDPAVYASILRLLTTQVNELSLLNIFRMASVVCAIEKPCSVGTTDSAEAETLKSLYTERDLLRTALALGATSKCACVDTLDSLTLLRFSEEMGSTLNDRDKSLLFRMTNSSLVANPSQQNLYTLVFMCAQLSLLGSAPVFIFNKLITMIRRKVNLAHRFPGSDQTLWLGAAIAALANLCVGAPHAIGVSKDNVETFATPPIMPNATIPKGYCTDSNLHLGVDFGKYLRQDWIKEVFTNVTGYVANRSTTAAKRGLNFQLQIAYTLALLGYRANSILKVAGVCQTSRDSSADTTQDPPWQPMIELLVGPPLGPETPLNLTHLEWIPRVDWQIYYRLAAEAAKNSTLTADQLDPYIRFKSNMVSSVAGEMQSRLRARVGLEVFTFHRCQVDSNGQSFFSDLLLRKTSKKFPGVTKLLLCFVVFKRDIVVNRPLNTLLSAYTSALPGIPVLLFYYSDFVNSNATARGLFCDNFLKEAAQLMMGSPGVPTAKFHMWNDFVD